MTKPRRSAAMAAWMIMGGIAATVVAALVAGPSWAASDSISERTSSWDKAAARLGVAGSLWEPVVTVGLPRSRPIAVRAEGITVAAAQAPAGRTQASTRYGTSDLGFTIDEKWASTQWMQQPRLSPKQGLVERVTLRLGPPGMRTAVRAVLYADCGRARCTRADVVATGGSLTLTARPSSTMTAPGETAILLRSRGMRAADLLTVARSVQQVAGSPAGGAGSGQMLGMCAQMVAGLMTDDQASAFAAGQGYSTRVGSIDGESLAVTADYRPDRFTVSLVGGSVASCTYG